jgi:DNA-3-methyladenine glycosylase II
MRKSIKALVSICPNMARAHKLIGTPPTRDRDGGFEALLRIIIDQQISVQAGVAIWKRVEVGLIECNPGKVVKVGEKALRSYGLSRPKAHCAWLLAVAILNGTLDLKALETCDNDAVRGQLMAIKGVGRWTAEIYLMFALNRPDVWPSGDLALAEAVKRLLKLERRPTPNELEVIAERWRPERTAAAVFLWHCYKKLPIE